jgi:hypothetical protein
VEAEAIDLMRDAARVEGMKIGSWVSLRMREAAEKALNRKPGVREVVRSRFSAEPSNVGQENLIKELSERLGDMERELRDLTKNQMAIMAKLLAQS